MSQIKGLKISAVKISFFFVIFSSFSVENFARTVPRGDALEFVDYPETNTEDGLLSILPVNESKIDLPVAEIFSVGKNETYPETKNSTALAQMWLDKYTLLLKSFNECENLENVIWHEKYVVMRMTCVCLTVFILILFLILILCNVSCKKSNLKNNNRYPRSDAIYQDSTTFPLRTV